MRESTLRKLIRLVEDSRISELEISRFWTRVRISKNAGPAAHPAVADQSASGARQEVAERAGGKSVPITAPMVGTFYRASAPDTPSYAEVGDEVVPGQVVCIIEAMKLMNEIESHVRGRIEKVLVENEEPVEYGQELFLVSVS
jgi:acetyl-CoA carboxylase biotin carboxyl carrier protein